MNSPTIPAQAQTLQVLRLMKAQPILMLGDKEAFGTRWTLDGEEVPPAIARFLLDSGYIEDAGKTGLGAHILALTDSGRQFREKGLAWWQGLSLFQKLKITLLG